MVLGGGVPRDLHVVAALGGEHRDEGVAELRAPEGRRGDVLEHAPLEVGEEVPVVPPHPGGAAGRGALGRIVPLVAPDVGVRSPLALEVVDPGPPDEPLDLTAEQAVHEGEGVRHLDHPLAAAPPVGAAGAVAAGRLLLLRYGDAVPYGDERVDQPRFRELPHLPLVLGHVPDRPLGSRGADGREDEEVVDGGSEEIPQVVLRRLPEHERHEPAGRAEHVDQGRPVPEEGSPQVVQEVGLREVPDRRERGTDRREGRPGAVRTGRCLGEDRHAHDLPSPRAEHFDRPIAFVAR
jgi:hypothetical protein